MLKKRVIARLKILRSGIQTRHLPLARGLFAPCLLYVRITCKYLTLNTYDLLET